MPDAGLGHRLAERRFVRLPAGRAEDDVDPPPGEGGNVVEHGVRRREVDGHVHVAPPRVVDRTGMGGRLGIDDAGDSAAMLRRQRLHEPPHLAVTDEKDAHNQLRTTRRAGGSSPPARRRRAARR